MTVDEFVKMKELYDEMVGGTPQVLILTQTQANLFFADAKDKGVHDADEPALKRMRAQTTGERQWTETFL